MTKQKDYPTLIQAIEIAAQQIPLQLVILGEGDEKQAIQDLIDVKNLNSVVFLQGFADNPFAWMKQADLFVLSSIIEGLSMVLLEALAYGCQVVSTDCPFGPSEVLQQGQYGTLVPIQDSQALASAIVATLTGSGTASGINYARQFTLEKAVDEYAALIHA